MGYGSPAQYINDNFNFLCPPTIPIIPVHPPTDLRLATHNVL